MNGSELTTFEAIFVGVAMIGIIIWMYPSVKRGLQRSEDNEVKKDWAGVLIPILAVVAFVFLLINMV